MHPGLSAEMMFEKNWKKKRPAKLISFLSPLVGLEPTTCGLTVRRSTD